MKEEDITVAKKRSSRVSERGMEEAVEEVMSLIDDLGGSKYMSKEQYVEFCEEVARRCQTNADTMNEELRNED